MCLAQIVRPSAGWPPASLNDALPHDRVKVTPINGALLLLPRPMELPLRPRAFSGFSSSSCYLQPALIGVVQYVTLSYDYEMCRSWYVCVFCVCEPLCVYDCFGWGAVCDDKPVYYSGGGGHTSETSLVFVRLVLLHRWLSDVWQLSMKRFN